MNKLLRSSFGVLVLGGLVAASAQVMSVSQGWQIMGASENIASMSVFKSDCVSSVYTYKNSSVGYMSYKPSATSNQISSLSAGDGFWIYGLSNCTIDTAGTSAATPPPPPPSSTTTTTTTTSSSSSTTASDSRALYDATCAGCHGTGMLGVSVSQLSSAISRVGSMRSLSSLTSTQLAAIAAAR